MSRKITAGALFIMMLMSLLSTGVLAEPYTEINIAADNVSYIEATDFDTEPYYETNPAEGEPGVREHEIQTEVGSSGYKGNISYTAASEWVQYTINVAADGNYKFDAYLASGAATAGNITLLYDDTEIGITKSEDVLGWDKYEWYEVGNIDMTAGTHVIRLDFVDGNTNIAAIRVTLTNMPETESETETPESETTPEPETEDATSADESTNENETADTTTTTASTDNTEDNNMILWVIVGAAAVVIIVVIIVIATKKKK